MRADWNDRAREDAHYYAAFGRRDQDDTEFFAAAADLIRNLESELRRLPATTPPAFSTRRALEIGCGPGRLMRPMSRHFGEIHGVDVSDGMIAQASAKLNDIPHAHLHHTSGSDLSLFPANHFDFVYSYAVFQHIPSADVVFSYLRETERVLKPGGFARLQLDGLPRPHRANTTWEGARVSADEIRAFTRHHNIRLLSLTGIDTQYMWTTWQKPLPCRIRHVVNAFSQEQAVPATGRIACATLQVENLPEACDLNSLEAFIDGVPGTPSYIGPPVNGLSQVNVFLPEGVRKGLIPVRLEWHGERLCPDAIVRVIPTGPAVPRLVSVSDGVNLISAQRIESRLMKAVLEEVESIDDFAANVDGLPLTVLETLKTDPQAARYEVNFGLPPAIAPGAHVLEIHMRKRMLTRMGIEVV
jgi:ubiquinone/menaquinone biosynthesis C-methylase UbiE